MQEHLPPETMAALGYTPERIARAMAHLNEHEAAITAAGAAQPARVTLADGRVLIKQRGDGHAHYQGQDGMRVLVSDDAGPHGTLRHVSVSYRVRDPRWTELKLVREAFFHPDQDVMIVLPRRGQYVNVHQHCFHLWQTPETWRGDHLV